MLGMSAEAIVRRTLSGLITMHPFFGTLALRMKLEADPTRKTMTSNGETIRYNPTWVEETDADKVRLAMAYGTLACALKHHVRREDRDPDTWKDASWEVCLPVLRDAGLTDELGGMDMSVEQAYKNLHRNQPPGGDGDGQQPQSSGRPQPNQGQGQDDSNQEQGQPPPQQGQGQGSGGQQQEPSSHDPKEHGEVSDMPNPTSDTDESADQQRQEAEQEWDDAMYTARQMAKNQGSMPGKMNEVVDGMHHSHIEWSTVLRRYMRDVAKTDYTWRKPNRRYPDLYLPSMASDGMGDMVFMIDTSASLDTESLEKLWGELRHVVQEVNPRRLVVIQADSEVQKVDYYTPQMLPEQLDAQGRGGTNYVPAFEEVHDTMLSPAVAVYLTDGYCDRFPDEPEYPVLWVLDCEKHDFFEPPFGEVLSLVE